MSETARRKKTSIKTVNEILDQFWVIEKGTDRPKGLLAMDYLYRDNPEAWLRFVGQYLPREVVLQNTLGEIDDDAIDDMILRIKQRVEDERKALEAKRIIGIEFAGSDAVEVGSGEIPTLDGEAGEGRNDHAVGD